MPIAWSTRQLREGAVLPPLPPLGMAHETSASSNSRLSAPLKRAWLSADYTSRVEAQCLCETEKRLKMG